MNISIESITNVMFVISKDGQINSSRITNNLVFILTGNISFVKILSVLLQDLLCLKMKSTCVHMNFLCMAVPFTTIKRVPRYKFSSESIDLDMMAQESNSNSSNYRQKRISNMDWTEKYSSRSHFSRMNHT